MGFRLIYGNDAEKLLDRLAERLRAPVAAASLLEPEIVLVPQFGLRRWLEIRLAEKLGIVANVDFYAPAEYAWELLRAAHPELSETSRFDRRLLRWRIFAELALLAGDPRFASLHALLGDGEPSARLHLATELAQLFERYLAYHGDLLARWQRGADAQDWQAQLWRRLIAAIDETHRADLLDGYVRRFAASHTPPPGLPQRLAAFACTNISPDLLRFYGFVARHCELDFLMPNPCRAYWGDVKSERARLREFGAAAFAAEENPLLAGYGYAGQQFVAQLFSYEDVQPLESEDDELWNAHPGDTLLRRVQRDILDRAPPMACITKNDTSIQFHVCASRLREVQVLHDQLVALFQDDDKLDPRDVAIMAPNIGAYAPYIEAVFGGIARGDPRYLPYTLSDCSAREAHALTTFALKLAALPLSRFGINEVIDLLGEPALARKLDLGTEDIDLLANWLRDAGVRWGLDETQHEDAGAGRYREFSWAFGLDRLLLGYASGSDDDIAGIAPLPAVEGSNAALLGAVLRVLEVLRDWLTFQRGTHTPAQWQARFNAVLDALLAIDYEQAEETRALASIRAALAALAEENAAAGVETLLDWQCVRDFLSENLSQPERSYRFFAGGISVTSMLPLRVVPFRVICLIGMNDEAFPRRDRRSALDRSDRSKRHGQRSDRDDDRYLFLQLLSSAGDVLYLSWIGEDQRDGSEREPSAVVAELLEVLRCSYFADDPQARARLVVKHPLQPFSPRLFANDDARVFTYREAWRDAARRARETRPLPPFVDTALPDANIAQPAQSALHLQQLHWFWRNPARAFFSERLGVQLPRSEDAGEDADPLELGGLGRYLLVDGLMQKQNAPESVAVDIAHWRARALLPVGESGAEAYADTLASAAELARVARAYAGDTQLERVEEFTLTLASGRTLTGSLPEHRGGLICRASAGALHGKRVLDAWIDLLVLAATTGSARLVLLGLEKDVVQTLRTDRIDSISAHLELERLLDGYALGQRQPLLFFPKTSYVYAERWRKNSPERGGALAAAIDADAFKAARGAYYPGKDDQGGTDSTDAAFALAARGLDPFAPDAVEAEDFATWALEVFKPLIAARAEGA